MNTEQEKVDLEAFLLALTDERVRFQKAPFDHPQLLIPNGHKLESSTGSDRLSNAKDQFIEIKAVGRGGSQAPKRFLQ